MSVEMQDSSNVIKFQQLWGSWTTQFNYLYDDPKVALLMKTRMGQYLSCHPFLALTVLVFSVMAALPVGLFLTFALVTIVISAVGFVFFEGFLLFVGGLTLLTVLSGLAFFSVLVSCFFNVFYIIISNIHNHYNPHLKKGGKVHGKENGCETSSAKETQ
ncbi:lipid droplet assembly factor 1-like [Thunnus maccoyii]|uniref:lipid droplet assembly factor 1-like n=1 Tax=Thunnus maccoyii TaxID=8240 RepID=UPI001C4D55AF|nr:lipid droplet assembly factor 1-like [Thunnus maccoyii]XP_042249631.1 lipid droplet assembly factor 1-like [Thunnus maccoyii]